MINKSVSDFVAASMDAVLNSQEHKSLFGTTYKYASDENDAKKGSCSKCGKPNFLCKCDKSNAEDMVEDSSEADDLTVDESADNSNVEDGSSFDDSAADDGSDFDESDADDDYDDNAAYDVAIDSLITASAAFDALGMPKSATVSLKLASLTVEAKKSDSKNDSKGKKKETAKSKDTKGKKDSSAGKKKTDSNNAKDKKKMTSTSKPKSTKSTSPAKSTKSTSSKSTKPAKK